MHQDDRLLAEWRAAHRSPVTGWDFSDLDGGLVQQEPPWSYPRMVRQVLDGASSAADLGTGGGELLLSLIDALPADTVATEGWASNIPVARDALAPQHIPVVQYDAERDPAMPFPDGQFDVVLDRHEAYVAAEVFRVLRPGGTFLTQQVDGRDLQEVGLLLTGRPPELPYAHITLDNLRTEAERAGFIVQRAEDWRGTTRFRDVTSLVRYLAHVPWSGPDDFDVDRYASRLLGLHRSGTPLEATERRFVLLCRRPGPGLTGPESGSTVPGRGPAAEPVRPAARPAGTMPR